MKPDSLLLCWLTLLVPTLTTPVLAQQTSKLAERLQSRDSDQNGTLSFSEAGIDRAVFNQIDADDNGELTIREVGRFLRNGGKLNQSKPSAPPQEVVGTFNASMPVNLKSCQAASEYSQRAAGHAVLIMVDGKIVYENYHNGWSSSAPHRLASGTKSFSGVAAAVAVQQGLFKWNDAVAETIVEWKNDTRLSKVTIRQLLSLVSGIDPGENSVVLPYSEAIQASSKHRAGTKFEYGPNPFQIFGELMKRKLKPLDQTYLEFLEKHIFTPIEMQVGQWRRTEDGDPHIPSGAFIAAREWAKFGELLRLRGQWRTKQLVPETAFKTLLSGSKANPRYGVTFWLNIPGGLGAGDDDAGRSTTPSTQNIKTKDLFMAAGAGKQRLYVIPSLKLTIVRFGESKSRQFRDDVFLSRLLKKSNS